MSRAIAMLVALTMLSAAPRMRGQQPREPSPSAAPMPVMSAAAAQAFVDAADRRVDYLPGEVVVKFKNGVAPEGQQRALDALRSRPGVDRLEWAGEVAVLRDPSQPDARVLAAPLASQPEVEYAQP